ncbi:MAG TPA: isoleucine--tRNA ligase [Thermoanaerobaculia bacterium]|nr:isoleucine--tRNA ligase [Thermoanaerobaculia bacterium]
MNDTPESSGNATVDDEAAKERKKRYKQSLNLPKTAFPMKANLRQTEPQSQARWEESDLYQRVLEARADAEPYVFHDGPPYANGSIHVGHLLNKTLKDLVVRSRLLLGQRCAYVPGWDCHGLPIEHRVLSGLVESGKIEKLKSLDEDTRRMAVRRECHAYASKYQAIQASEMKRLLTLADYDHPYLTMTPDYEAATLEVFAELIEQGIVYRDLKPVHWSIANETALAEAELEYRDRTDPSIFVWFDAADPQRVAATFGAELGEGDLASLAFMIWTTTPWTLPANLLIAVHEDFEYSLVRVGDARARRVGVVATELVERVAREAGVEVGETYGKVRGAALAGLGYRHPFRDDGPEGSWRVVLTDYVTLEDGTGLVHTAPGHGAEDYATGQREELPVYCPVLGDGTYDDSVPDWLRGVSIWDANETIVERLRTDGALFHHAPYPHSYPHDWRSKTPVIFRCTEQWFFAVDRPLRRDGRSLREVALEAARERIRFVPEWGQKRLAGMIESRPDWCISRQRAWGLPIPAFRRPDGSVFLTAASVRAVAQVFAAAGSDAWFTQEPQALLAGYDAAADPQAPERLGDEIAAGRLEKLYDIFDVWFESGSSWNAVMRQRDLGFPCDLYLEGSDQHRGWFQSSLLPALGVTGSAPYRTLLTHGFIVDKEGRKMSKSLGNTLEVSDLLRDFGADVCRWWVSSLAYENDIKVDRDFFELAGEGYRKVRNTLRFLLSNLHDFDPAAGAPAPDPHSLDAWALERASELRDAVAAAYERFDFRQAHLLLFGFCNDTLSSVYLDAVKDRLYCDRPDSARRRVTQGVLFTIADLLCSALAPIVPHTADEAWRALHGLGTDPGTGASTGGESAASDTVHLHVLPEIETNADSGWSAVLAIHDDVDRALESAKSEGIDNPLDAGLRLPDPDGALAAFEAELPDLFGVSRVELTSGGGVEVVDLRGEPRCERSWRRDGTVRRREDGGWLSDRDAEAVGLS